MNDKKVIALGMFDGVHIGHRALIRRAKEIAEIENASCLVYSFSNHPNQLLGKPYSLLTTNEEKERLLKEVGADEVILESFTEDIMHIQPEEFLHFLCSKWNICGMVAGYNYSFGDKGNGNSQLMEQFCKNKDIQCAILPPIEKGGIPVSATRIRNLLNEGNILSAAGCLGYPYMLNSNISSTTSGLQFIPDMDKVLPKSGRYALKIKTDKREIFGYYSFISNKESQQYIQVDTFVPEKDEKDFRFSFINELEIF